ncbi:hypothetical protein KR222_000299, partial [Zaprionus bogoriensis]
FLFEMLRLLILLLPLTWAYNYCNNDTHYCQKLGLKHFICQIKKELKPHSDRSKFVGAVPDTYAMRDMILSYHNKFRDELASGNLRTSSNKTFKPARRMRELIWDTELGYMARLHASTVSFKHTKCRAVTRFPYVGENLGLVFVSAKKRSIREILDLTVKKMFEEYRDVEDPDELIKSFKGAGYQAYGHFTVIASDRVSRVGCAVVAGTDFKNKPDKGLCYYVTCHYDFTNMEGEYIYKAGDPRSACDDWKASKSGDYSNLCTNTKEIFPKVCSLLIP